MRLLGWLLGKLTSPPRRGSASAIDQPFVITTDQLKKGPSEAFQVDCAPSPAVGGPFWASWDFYEAARAEWESCADPDRLLGIVRGHISDRKLRLVACACCRRWLEQFDPEQDRMAVQVGEWIADREVNRQEYSDAHILGFDLNLAEENAYNVACRAILVASVRPANRPIPGHRGSEQWTRTVAEERRALCDLLRDILGNPYRSRSVERAWLTWNRGTVLELARAIYTDRAVEYLPILADALEEAGCSNGEILGHCRQAQQHFRGCWVVDLLLGKE